MMKVVRVEKEMKRITGSKSWILFRRDLIQVLVVLSFKRLLK